MVQDVRFALRLIAKDRAFSLAAILVLALGIGVNATGFTLVKGVFLRGRSLSDANQIYVLSWRMGATRRMPLSYLEFGDWRGQARSFASIAAVTNPDMNIGDDRGAPEHVYGARVTSEAFTVFELQPLIGRAFTPEDERLGAAPVAIINHQIWKERYREDPSIVGGTMRINGAPVTIVGVMPPDTRFPGNAKVWTPMVPTATDERRINRSLQVYARLKPDVSRRAAAAESAGIAQRLIAAHPDDTRDLTGAIVESVPERFVGGPARTMFLAMLGAVSFVLLIACANVANLLLSRSAYRAREVAMRLALGATRLRVVRQLLVETMLLALIGGALGLFLAIGGVRLFDSAVLDPTRPYWIVFEIDYTILAYVAGVCVMTAVAAGLAPALQASRANAPEVLKEGARGSVGSPRTRWFSSALVVSQIALTIILLAGAGLMVRSFNNLRSADAEYSSTDVLAVRLQLPRASYGDLDKRRAFLEQLEERLWSLHGVTSLAFTSAVPPGNNEERRIDIEGATLGEPPLVSLVRITPRFLDVLDRRMMRGRALDASDHAPGSEGVLINERLARQFFGDDDPIGRRIRFAAPATPPGQAPRPPGVWRTIVGITPNVRHSSPQDAESDPVVYVPNREEPPMTPWILIRTTRTTADMSRDIRAAVQAVDRDQPVYSIQRIEQLLQERRWPYTAFGGAFAIFAFVALVLSAVGLYALMSYAVTQRTQEIGVRMAIGAQRQQVAWLFLKRGLQQLAIGLTLGLAGAFALSGVLQSVLVRVTPGDPATFISVAAVLLVVTIGACMVPVFAATRITPMIALRNE